MEPYNRIAVIARNNFDVSIYNICWKWFVIRDSNAEQIICKAKKNISVAAQRILPASVER